MEMEKNFVTGVAEDRRGLEDDDDHSNCTLKVNESECLYTILRV